MDIYIFNALNLLDDSQFFLQTEPFLKYMSETFELVDPLRNCAFEKPNSSVGPSN